MEGSKCQQFRCHADRGVARRQHGLVTTTQLLELGVSRRQIEGVDETAVASNASSRRLPVAVARRRREQQLVVRRGSVGRTTRALVSHRSAGELWGFDGVKRRNAGDHGADVGQEAFRPMSSCISTRSPVDAAADPARVPTTTPERTLIDLAGSLRPDQLEIAFESARRERHVTTASVERALARIGTQGRRGSEAMQQVLTALAHEPPCESALEVRTARLLRASGLPKPARQVSVTAFDRELPPRLRVAGRAGRARVRRPQVARDRSRLRTRSAALERDHGRDRLPNRVGDVAESRRTAGRDRRRAAALVPSGGG